MGRQHLSNSSEYRGAETKEISPWNFCQERNQFCSSKKCIEHLYDILGIILDPEETDTEGHRSFPPEVQV